MGKILPQLDVLEKYGPEIYALASNRIDSSRTIVIANESLQGAGLYRKSEIPIQLAEVINKSRQKQKYIKTTNAFFFGDEEEYDEPVSHTKLRKLHFYEA